MERILDRPVGSLIKWDWEKTLYALLIVLALGTRLWGLGDRVQSHDESIHTRYSWNLYSGRGFAHDPLMHGPFLFHATALSYFLFGDNDFTARVPVALMGVALVGFPYLLRKWLGRTGALATSFFLLISPAISYYSRYIRHDIPAMLFAMVTVYAILSYLRDGRPRWLYVMAAGVSLGFASKEVAFIYDAIFGLFLLGLFVVEALKREWRDDGLKAIFLIALAIMVFGLAVVGSGIYFKPEEGPIPWWAKVGAGIGGLGLVGAVALLLAGVWRNLRDYRAFDLIIVLGTLCLPLLAPFLIREVGPLIEALGLQLPPGGVDPLDYQAPMIYYSAAITGLALAVSALIGLLWDWRRWSIAAAAFYAIFIVLFTTFFTNGYGMASGLVGSLGYWLKQQDVERGSQPVYYYVLMVALYEYLPWLLATVAAIYVGAKALLGRSLAPVDAALPDPEADDPGAGGRVEPLPELSDPLAPVAAGVHQSQHHPATGAEMAGRSGEITAPQARGAFVPFLLFWCAVAWFGYSFAGERMPWLTVHITLPMILLSGWLVGRFIDAVDWREALERRAWLIALVLPPFLMALIALVKTGSAGPFRGLTLDQLRVTGRWMGAVVGTSAFGAGLLYLGRRTGWRIALSVVLAVLLVIPVLLTIRTAWHFNFINYDYAVEHLVYAHAAPGVHEAMRQLEELSRRLAGGPEEIEVAYGSDGSTLWYWQLRNYDNAVFYGDQPSREQMDVPVIIAGSDQWDTVSPYLGDDYHVNTYTYIWWPVEDYRGLTLDRVTHAVTDTQTRLALWDIWYARDYRRYDEVTGREHTVDKWPLRQDFRFYVRKDVASQIWDLGTTGLGAGEALEEPPTDPYESGWADLGARLVIGSEGAELGQLQGPRGIAVDDEGFIYVADSGNHRIQKFAPDGQFVVAFGKQSFADDEIGVPQGFNEPWSVAVDAGGDIYVADTWNHRVQRLDDQGRVLNNWGVFGQTRVGELLAQGVFYGPRDIALDAEGRIFVTDTGNKRVQVFEPDGTFAFDWGGGGIAAGYLDEPVGIAIGPTGEVYVADTWNKRIQVFDREGAYLREWPIEGWEETSVEDKPYLAVDSRGYVYVADPGKYRVLVFDSVGGYQTSFGQYGFDERSFALPTGIAIGDDGSIYVTDARSGRVLVFDPLRLGLGFPGADQLHLAP